MIKFDTIKRTRTGSVTIDGTTNPTTTEYEVQIPRVPADWDARGLKAAAAVVLAMTAASVAWSTLSIGSLLAGGVGYAAAGLFDASWLVVILLEWLSRFDPAKRKFAKRTGWGLLALTMGAIFWHGLLTGGVALGVVGAVVSLVAKVMWWGVMRHIDKDLSPEHQQWVAAEVSKSNAKVAIAGVRRQAARAESAAVAELLAAEAIRSQYEAAGILNLSGQAPAVAPAPAVDLSALLSGVRPTSAPEPVEADEPQVSVYADPEPVRPVPARTPVAATFPTFIAPQAPAAVRPASAPEPVEVEVEDDQDVEPVPAADPGLALVPALAGLSVAGAVRTLKAKGVNDDALLTDLVPVVLGRPVDADSLKREIRRQRTGVTTPAATAGTGLYL